MVEARSELFFSLDSLREIAIKAALRKPDFSYNAALVYDGLIKSGWKELAVNPSHVFALAELPLFHRDPFDRMIVAQAMVEELTLITADSALSRYDVSILMAT